MIFKTPRNTMPKLIFPTSMESGEPLATFGRNTLVMLSYTPWVYLHGTLETESCNLGGWDKFKWYYTAPETDGIYKCGVAFTNERIVEANAYLWEAKFGEGRTKVTGLVVANDDIEGNAFAQKKWEEKSDFI
jgi:hypothetical protein